MSSPALLLIEVLIRAGADSSSGTEVNIIGVVHKTSTRIYLHSRNGTRLGIAMENVVSRISRICRIRDLCIVLVLIMAAVGGMDTVLIRHDIGKFYNTFLDQAYV